MKKKTKHDGIWLNESDEDWKLLRWDQLDLWRIPWHFSINRCFLWVACSIHSFFTSYIFLPLPPWYRSSACRTLFLPHPINWLPVQHHAPCSVLEGCQGGIRGTEKRAVDLLLPLTLNPYLHPSLLSAPPVPFIIPSLSPSPPLLISTTDLVEKPTNEDWAALCCPEWLISNCECRPKHDVSNSNCKV